MAGPEVEEQCRQLGMPLAAPLAEGWALPTGPRCLHLEKGPQGFGFLLREEKGHGGHLGEWKSGSLGVGTVFMCTYLLGVSLSVPCPDLLLGTRPSLCPWLTWGARKGTVSSICVPGQFLWEVDPGLPADKAGMQAGDRLVAVAGESVEGLGHDETVSRIRAQGSRVALTVVDPEADRFFRMVRGAGAGARAQLEGCGQLEAAGLSLLPPGAPVPSPLPGKRGGPHLPTEHPLGLWG